MNVVRPIVRVLIVSILLLACEKGSDNAPAGAPKASAAASAAEGPVVEGASAPTFSFKTLDDKTASLSDFAGKVVLLNFWATWCVPCVEEMPALERLQKRFGGEGLVIVSINVDPEESLEAVKQFVASNGITFPVLRDPEFSLAPQYSVSGFPESFFIDGQGRFLAVPEIEGAPATVRFVGDRAWDSPHFFKMTERLLAAQKK